MIFPFMFYIQYPWIIKSYKIVLARVNSFRKFHLEKMLYEYSFFCLES